MKYALCSISFRHQLVSFADLVRFARRHGFDGIELWGTHACYLYDYDRYAAQEQLHVLRQSGMAVSMLSDYLDIAAEPLAPVLRKADKLFACARWLGVDKLRIFAGQQPSAAVAPAERARYVRGLRAVCERAWTEGIYIVVETHPNTLADNFASTLQLLEEVGCQTLGINLDFLHLWEAGDDPVASFRALEPRIRHFHLKNIATAAQLDVFQPQHVFSASGPREGMVRLADGALDYRAVLAAAGHSEHFASLEWFGPDPFRVLAEEIGWLHELRQQLALASGTAAR